MEIRGNFGVLTKGEQLQWCMEERGNDDRAAAMTLAFVCPAEV